MSKRKELQPIIQTLRRFCETIETLDGKYIQTDVGSFIAGLSLLKAASKIIRAYLASNFKQHPNQLRPLIRVVLEMHEMLIWVMEGSMIQQSERNMILAGLEINGKIDYSSRIRPLYDSREQVDPERTRANVQKYRDELKSLSEKYNEEFGKSLPNKKTIRSYFEENKRVYYYHTIYKSLSLNTHSSPSLMSHQIDIHDKDSLVFKFNTDLPELEPELSLSTLAELSINMLIYFNIQTNGQISPINENISIYIKKTLDHGGFNLNLSI